MLELYYIGLDVHKKSISFCIKTQDGAIIAEGHVEATRTALTGWAAAIEHPWVGALEATLFTGWIYDHLKDFALELQVAYPAMLTGGLGCLHPSLTFTCHGCLSESSSIRVRTRSPSLQFQVACFPLQGRRKG